MKEIKLFNCTVGAKNTTTDLKLSQTIPFGVILDPHIAARKDVDNIIRYIQQTTLNGYQYNQTFYKSWKERPEIERKLDQIIHYLSTYGTDFSGEIYLPQEVLDVPKEERKLYIIESVSKKELQKRLETLAYSNIAFKQETLNDIIEIAKNYKITLDVDKVQNREFQCLLAEITGNLPKDPISLLRFILYKTIGETLVIKSNDTIYKIKQSNKPIDFYDQEALSTIFYRFKSIFLAFKASHPRNKRFINQVRRLAKKNHTPFIPDVLGMVTSETITPKQVAENIHKATNFRKISILNAIKSRLNSSEYLVYTIRNGKSWYEEKKKYNRKDLRQKFQIVYNALIDSIKEYKGEEIVLPSSITLALPTSEKNFIGNIPEGSFIEYKDNVSIGIFWKNKWGANDFDLSATSTEKIGWNSRYSNSECAYSGDITDAPNGATEVLRFDKPKTDYLVMTNRYYGEENSQFKMFLAKDDAVESINKDYTINPNTVQFEEMLTSTQKEQTLGLITPNKFIFATISTGNTIVSNVRQEIKEFYLEKHRNPILLETVLLDANIPFTKKDIQPSKDTILKVLS